MRHFGGAGRFADSVYDRNTPQFKTGGAGEAYTTGKGYSSNEERLTSEALSAQLDVDPEELRARRWPGAPVLFPPRLIGERTQPTLDDVVQVDRRYPDSSAQFSGSSGGYSGSSVPSIGWW